MVEVSDTADLVAVFYTEEDEINQLLSAYEGLVEFESVDSEEEVRLQLLQGKAECGYFIPDDIAQKLQGEAADREIQVLEAEDAMFTGVVNEVLFEQLYSQTSYAWYADYMDKLGVYDDSVSVRQNAQDALNRRMQDGSTFTFERQILQPTSQESSGQVTYPVWIIIVLQVLLCGLSGVFQSIRDYTKHYYYKRSYVVTTAIMVIQPMLVAALAGALTIFFYNSY